MVFQQHLQQEKVFKKGEVFFFFKVNLTLVKNEEARFLQTLYAREAFLTRRPLQTNPDMAQNKQLKNPANTRLFKNCSQVLAAHGR